MQIHQRMKSSNTTQNNSKLSILKRVNLEFKPLDKEHQICKLKQIARERLAPCRLHPLLTNQFYQLLKSIKLKTAPISDPLLKTS